MMFESLGYINLEAFFMDAVVLFKIRPEYCDY